MKAQVPRLFAALALILCFSAACMALTGDTKGIDPALLVQANAGSAEAEYQVGTMYFLGHGVQPDYVQAAAWYRKGAEQGDADSQFQLGGLYHSGQGVPQDSAQAFAWVKKAADQGHLDAELFIATCYTMGWGVAPDDAQAAVWHRKAGAEQGDAHSQFYLGHDYATGTGVVQDYSEAYFWFDLAASGEANREKRKRATKERDEAASHLTPEELTAELERARKWIQDHPTQAQ